VTVPGAPSTEIGQALMMMTELLGRTIPKAKDELDLAFGNAGSVSGEPGGIGPALKDATAARAVLEGWLRDKPEMIYEAMEKRMLEGVPYNSLRDDGRPDSRYWAEFRSRISSYRGPMTWGWVLAGIHDCLSREPNPSIHIRRARARAICALAAADQLSIDSGSWLVASELLLENEPPIASFEQHGSRTLTVSPFSSLVDPRHQSIHLGRLRALDEMGERKRRLAKGRGKGKKGKDEDNAEDGGLDGAPGAAPRKKK